MRRALALAARGRGGVEPNPMVGCVLVKNGRIVGEGYHRRFGGPHAEVNALRSAGRRARGATAYVTLEPCCHHGKTPPCTDALIAAGIVRVVAAMRDPFPKVRGRGVRLLRSAGMDVAIGLCETEARRLNGPHIKLQRMGLPWVILKWAQSLDGRIATRTGDSKWISGEAARRRVHRLRGMVDAVIVGVGTAIADDPSLTCRWGRPQRVATRMVLDPSLRTPVNARLVRTAREVPTILVTGPRSGSAAKRRTFERAGVELLRVGCGPDGLDLTAMLRELGRRGMANVLVEGGGRTLGSFLDAGLADEALVFVSRRLMGGREAVAAVGGRGPELMKELCRPVWSRLSRCGEDDVYELRFTE